MFKKLKLYYLCSAAAAAEKEKKRKGKKEEETDQNVTYTTIVHLREDIVEIKSKPRNTHQTIWAWFENK